MNIYRINATEINIINKSLVCCIGFFDGLHLGHQELITNTIRLANKLNVESALITFEPDPWVITKGLPIDQVQHINDLNVKLELLNKFGINNLIILEFDQIMSHLTSEQFTKVLYDNIDIKGLVYGFDFHYGYKGSGNHNTLKLQVHSDTILKQITSIDDDIGKISSSRISSLLIEGSVKKVNKLLGYKYYIKGKVICGNAKGRTIGFPTANVEYSKELLLPKIGVYIGYVKYLNNYYKAIINIGNNPTFNYVNKVSLETYILDFNKDIYDEIIDIIFVDYLRDETKFSSIFELKNQLNIDSNKARELSNYE